MFNGDNTARVSVGVAALRGPSFILTDSLKLLSLLATAVNTQLRHPARKTWMQMKPRRLRMCEAERGSSGFQKDAFLLSPL